MTYSPNTFRFAEFFAGIGLVRLALEDAMFEAVWANDIEPAKHAIYESNFGDDEFLLGDVRLVNGGDLPNIELATASFPCTDLSLAGNRRGLAGEQSGMFWEFARVLREMDTRMPEAVLLENVPSFASSHGGEDMRAAIAELNSLGYVCDPFVINASTFVAQSRPRLFIVGRRGVITEQTDRSVDLRPSWLNAFLARYSDLEITTPPLSLPDPIAGKLGDSVERLGRDDARWWDDARTEKFVESLSDLQFERLSTMKQRKTRRWATAYRRTRGGTAVWEIRNDSISGCLRTARGGSSRQALVEAGNDEVRVRWMTPREYARLQGVPDDFSLDSVSVNKALFGLGDAVCVPAVRWIGENYLWPAISGSLSPGSDLAIAA